MTEQECNEIIEALRKKLKKNTVLNYDDGYNAAIKIAMSMIHSYKNRKE